MAPEFVLAIVVNAVLIVVGFFGIMRASEKYTMERIEAAKEEAKKMHEVQETRIKEAEHDAKSIRENYNTKFAGVHEAIRSLEKNVMAKVTEVSEGMRASNHNLADNVTKALNRMELTIVRFIPEARIEKD